MANGDTDTETTDETQDYAGLTREQKAVALGVTLQGLAAIEGQSTQPVAAPPVAAPTAPVAAPLINRGGQQYAGSPAVAAPPAPQGRMYMGPRMSPDQEAAFAQSPAGTNVNRMPGWTPDSWAAATRPQVNRAPPPETIARLNAYDAAKQSQQANSWQDAYTRGGQTDLSGLTKEMELRNKAASLQRMYDWNQSFQKAKVSGLSDAEAMKSVGPPPDVLAKSSLKAQPQTEELVTKRDALGNLFQFRAGKWWHVPEAKAPTDTVTETIPAVQAKPGTAAVPAKPPKKILGVPIPFTGQDAEPAVPDEPGHGEMKRTRHVPSSLSSTATATAPAVKPPEQAKKSGEEVTRVTKDGRRAVFDSKTKQFLRYAD